jgi:hypothetical protein
MRQRTIARSNRHHLGAVAMTLVGLMSLGAQPAAAGTKATSAALVATDPLDVAQSPTAVAIDGAAIYLSDGGVGVVRRVTSVSRAETVVAGNGEPGFAGDGGPSAAAQLCFPDGLAFDHHDNMAIADSISVDYTGDDHCTSFRVRVVAGASGTFYGQAMTSGDIYTIAGNGNPGFSGDGGPGTSAGLCYPSAVATDANSNLVIADSTLEDPIDDLLCTSNRVRIVAGSTGTFYGQAMIAGHVYTVAGNGTFGPSGDGGPATGAALAGPNGVTVDAAGNIVIADNNQVRIVAERTGPFYGQSMVAGDIYTVAGNGTAGSSGDGRPALAAQLMAAGVAVDPAGSLVIADSGQRMRVVAARTGHFYGVPMIGGDIYTVAGTGQFGYSGDGGPAVLARLRSPAGVAVDSEGNLMVADAGNQRVRVVALSNEEFYGLRMTKGDIFTVAGDGSSSDADGD